jgi:TonB-linked SusC/RagA family outer membrane protein
MYNFYPKKLVQPPGCSPNFLLTMKLTTLILITAILQVSARTYAQKVTLSEKNAPLNKVFEIISQQTGYDFLISTENLKHSKAVTITLENDDLHMALDKIFTGQPLKYEIQEKMVVISKKDAPIIKQHDFKAIPPPTFKGRVTDENGNPLSGATVRIKGTDQGTITDKNGEFEFLNLPKEGTFIIQFVSFVTTEFNFSLSTHQANISLHETKSTLNEVQVIGYGTTTKMLNTGSVSTISADEIANQPVTNVQSALSGRASGVFVQTTNGLPGGNINIQIRGQGSITAGNNPLYIIDGVPFSSSIGSITPLSVLSTGSINGSINPFNSINSSDIESITILKDADATAIYGSRGSNGVVLITTKKGKAGQTKATFNLSEGSTRATAIPTLLNADQYQMILREAYQNDGILPSADINSNNYVPELTIWKDLKTVDWAKYLLGGTGHFTSFDGSVTGGSNGTTFLISGNYHSEKTYLPGNNLYTRGGIYSNLQHTSPDGRLYLQFSNSLTLDNNLLVNPSADIAYDLLLPPNYPIYDNTGNFNWYAGVNPVAEINATSQAKTANILENLTLRYSFTPSFDFKINSGYNLITANQIQINPSSSLYPGTLNYTNFGKNSTQSLIIEPQVNYSHHFNNSIFSLLIGSSYQTTVAQGESIIASNFSGESLMKNLASGGSYIITNNYTQYKYISLFGRINYNIDSKYILNATIRRDGSSRFGAGNQFGNFGSVGGAWLWANEKFVKLDLPFITYGKLRASYGLTGNDQISDYQYLSTYGSSGYTYEGVSGLKPTRIANTDFKWETTKKLEFALEVGLIHNRLLFNINRYQDRTSDQLIAYSIPSISGFTSYQANLPAVVQNTGWEFELNTKNIQNKNFTWSSNFNVTIPKNQLKSFPNLSTSSYANTLVIGEDINRIYGYRFAGIDQSGSALYATKDGGNVNFPNSSTDSYFTIGSQSPKLYGGIGNTITYKRWTMDIFGQFAKQKSLGNLMYIPGAQQFNNYTIALNRWSESNTKTSIPKPSSQNDYSYYQSSANYFNTSYFRLKNIAVSYSLDKVWLKKLGADQGKLFFQAQNMLTLWDKNNPLLDPESGTFSGSSNHLPPSKSLVFGLQFTF